MTPRTLSVILLCILGAPPAVLGDDSRRLLRIDHYVRVNSKAPALQGRTAQIYVREVVQAGPILRGAVGANGVVLFIHGAGTPAEVAFDVPYQDYSWMAFLAQAGFDVFAMDMTGYGRSTRPEAMNDPCNLSAEQQAQFIPSVLPAPCAATTQVITDGQSDWNDIGAVVDHLRKLRRVEQVSLIGWSLGGPRAGGYAAQNPEKVSRLLLFSPAYRAAASARQSNAAQRVAMNTQSRAEFDANWDRQIGCPDQFDMAARNAVWAEMMASDPVGASWGSGVRRAPNVSFSAGWDAGVVGRMKTPALFIAPAHDVQATPKNVAALMADYGGKNKVLLDLACTGHNALWERNHTLMFKASAEWLAKGTVNGQAEGTVKLGY